MVYGAGGCRGLDRDRLCGRKIFSFPENLILVFASGELLKH